MSYIVLQLLWVLFFHQWLMQELRLLVQVLYYVLFLAALRIYGSRNTDSGVVKTEDGKILTTLGPVNAVERYTQLNSYPLHKTNKAGILSVDIHQSKDLITTGGVDTNAVVFDRSSREILSTLGGHSNKVTSVKFVAKGELVVAGSADKSQVGIDDRGNTISNEE